MEGGLGVRGKFRCSWKEVFVDVLVCSWKVQALVEASGVLG